MGFKKQKIHTIPKPIHIRVAFTSLPIHHLVLRTECRRGMERWAGAVGGYRDTDAHPTG